MADISKCANKKCKIKNECYRHTAPDGYWQSYMMFGNNKEIKDKKECKDFILYKRNKKVGSNDE